jgi:hypothetical protein
MNLLFRGVMGRVEQYLNDHDHHDSFPMIIVTSVVFDVVIIGLIVAYVHSLPLSSSSVSMIFGWADPTFERFVAIAYTYALGFQSRTIIVIIVNFIEQ